MIWKRIVVVGILFDTATYLAMVLHTYATLSCGSQKNHSLFLVVLRKKNHTVGVNPPIHFLAQISLKSLRSDYSDWRCQPTYSFFWRRSLRESTQDITNSWCSLVSRSITCTDPYARSTYSLIFIRAICTAGSLRWSLRDILYSIS